MWLASLLISTSILNVSSQLNIADESTALVSLEDGNGRHLCTGIAISEDKVVTPASCLHPNPANLRIRESISADDHAPDLHSVSSICIHARFNKQNAHMNDIGIIKLSEPFKSSNHFSPFKLLDRVPEKLENMKLAEISGLAFNDEGKMVGIHMAFVFIVNKTYCAHIYEGVESPSLGIASDQICAAGQNTAGPCTGDAGAPLLYDGEVLAFVSHWKWGEICDRINAPAVFTSIPYHYQWIKAFLLDFGKNKENVDLAQCWDREIRKPPLLIEPWYDRIMNGLIGA